MGFSDYKYVLGVKDERSQDGFSGAGSVSDSCLVFVYTAGSKTLATIYSDENRTSLANPITRAQFEADAGIKFFSSASSHDLVVAHSDGSIARAAGITPNDHSIKLDRDGVHKCLIAAFGASDNTEVDTGLDLPYGVQITDCVVQVVTADATETIDVGLLSSETAGDANGLLTLQSVASTGYVANQAYTAGANETYLSANYYGALMGTFLVGADAAGDVGTSSLRGHIVTGSNAVSLTYTGSAGSDTAAGYIYVYFRHLR